jgi:hypothetical protein
MVRILLLTHESGVRPHHKSHNFRMQYALPRVDKILPCVASIKWNINPGLDNKDAASGQQGSGDTK